MKGLIFLIPLLARVIFPPADVLACDPWSPPTETPSVPEPMTLLLVGCGIVGLGVLRKKFK